MLDLDPSIRRNIKIININNLILLKFPIVKDLMISRKITRIHEWSIFISKIITKFKHSSIIKIVYINVYIESKNYLLTYNNNTQLLINRKKKKPVLEYLHVRSLAAPKSTFHRIQLRSIYGIELESGRSPTKVMQ